MLFFNIRLKLAEKYEEWLNEPRDFKPANIPQTVIAWLTIEGLLDEDKVIEFINKE